MRPKTAGRQRPQQVEDEFGDEEIGDDLLPEWENKTWIIYYIMWNRWYSKFCWEEETFYQVANTYIFLQRLGFNLQTKLLLHYGQAGAWSPKNVYWPEIKASVPKEIVHHWSSRTSVLWSHYFIIILAHLTLRKAPHACSHCMSKCCWILVKIIWQMSMSELW